MLTIKLREYWNTLLMGKRTEIIILHCSDSDVPGHDNIATIRDWHRSRGFNDVGYNFFIRKGGMLEVGRSLSVPGAHCLKYNTSSIGICLSGVSDFNESQFETLRYLLNILMGMFDIGSENVVGHYELNNRKTCPNINMNDFRRTLNDKYNTDKLPGRSPMAELYGKKAGS